MASHDKKVNIYLKKFLTQQQITENFLDYLLKQITESFGLVWQRSGIFIPNIETTTLGSSSAPDTFDIITQLLGTDGLDGHILNLDSIDAVQINFENALGIPYYVGLRYNNIPAEANEVNVRTGEIKYTFFEEVIGELASPDSVVDDGDETLTIIVDSVFEAGVSNAGRKVKLYLKNPVSLVDAFEECVVQWDGSNNYVETTTALGQTLGNISVDENDYQAFASGATVRRNTDLRLDPDILFLFIVDGAGAGNSPVTFDQSDAQNLSYGLAGMTDLFDVEHSLLDGTHEDITAKTITTKQTVPGIQLDTQVNASDEDVPDAPVVHTLFPSVGGTGLQDAKWVMRNSGGQIIAFFDAHGNLYVQNLAAVESLFQSNLVVEGNTVLGDDINTDIVTLNSSLQSLTDMLFVIDNDNNGTNSYKFYKHSIGALNLLVEILETGDLVAARHLIATNDVLTGAGTEYTKNSDLTAIETAASLNEVYDETLNRKLLKVIANNPADKAVLISPSYITLADGSKYALPNGPLLSNYAGGSVNFETGVIVGGGANFTPTDFTGFNDQWKKFSLNLLQSNEILVLPAEGFGVTAALAPNPPLSQNAIAFTIVAVQNDSVVSTTAIRAIVESNLTRIPVGGGGSGSGDASSVQSRLEDWLDESFYEFLDANVFSIDSDDKLTSTTGTYNYTTSTYDLDVGEQLISWPILDDEFLAALLDIETIAIALVFSQGDEDLAPVVEVSRNGGAEYQPVTMVRVGNSDTFHADFEFETEASEAILHQYDIVNADTNLVLNATTLQARSEEFTTTQYEVVKKITAYINKTGTPSGLLYVRLVKDNAGSPSVDPSDILNEQLVNVSSLVAGDNVIAMEIGKRPLASLTKYHLVFATDDAYKSSFSAGVHEIAVKADTGGPIDSQVYDGAVWTDVVGITLCYLVEGRELNLLLKYTSGTLGAKLKGYGVLYGAEFGTLSSLKRQNRFSFNGTLQNLNEFQLTFEADPDFLKCYHVYEGQTFMVPAFDLQGNKAVFPVNFFQGNDDVMLIFQQGNVGSIDESSSNKKILQENHFGSSDVSLDYSASGRGPKIRNASAILRELALDEDDNIIILTVP